MKNKNNDKTAVTRIIKTKNNSIHKITYPKIILGEFRGDEAIKFLTSFHVIK